jgi:hypothetical protein
MSHYAWDIFVATQRAHVVLPAELIKEIDAAVGPRGRSAFIAEVTRAELRRRWLLDYFRSGKPAMRDEDHPEWANGVDAWLRELRRPGEEHLHGLIADSPDDEEPQG